MTSLPKLIRLSDSYLVNSQIELKEVGPLLNPFKGWLLTHVFHKALRIEQNKKVIYIEISSLIKNLCCSPYQANIAQDKKVQNLILEILNPIIGNPISYQSVADLVHQVRFSSLPSKLKTTSSFEAAHKEVILKLEEIKEKRLAKISFEVEELKKQLKPGDLLFRKISPENHNSIVTVQTFFKPLIFNKKDREGNTYSHVALYLGDGRIAEAAWPTGRGDEIRILRLEDERFSLSYGNKNTYLVTRCTDSILAQKATEVAARVAYPLPPLNMDQKQKTPFRYTILQAARSMWHPHFFGPMGKYRYLKQYIDYKRQTTPVDFMHPKKFFCSYLVGYSYQVAEAMKMLPSILGENDRPPKGFTQFDHALFRGLWARLRRWQHYFKLDNHVQMKFDAKRLSPQSFRTFIVRNPQLFKDVFLIKGRL